MRILFQGDSVTDVGRDREDFNNLGNGYVKLIAEQLGQAFECLNRGVSGNRVTDLQERWQEDCLDLKPDLLSILIGINDVWRRYDDDDPTSTEAYEAGYRDLLAKIRTETKAKLIILEPFLLHTTKERASWREDLDPKRSVAAKLAEEFDAVFIPMDSIFTEATKMKEPSYWAEDGVHPSEAGHRFIADTWVKKFMETKDDQ